MELETKKVKKRVEKEKNRPKLRKQFDGRQKPRHSNYGSTLASSLGNKGLNTFFNGMAVQAKLNVGQSGDPYELEADKTANQIVSKNSTGKISKIRTSGTGSGKTLSTKSESQIKGLSTGGQSLGKSTRDYFEPRFGVDLSSVKIHTGSKAGNVTKKINARALTYGNNIAFAKGEYNPGTTSGKKLLAHELTHVIQQSGGKEKSSGAPAKTKAPTYNHLALKRNTNETSVNLNKTSPGIFNNYDQTHTARTTGITDKFQNSTISGLPAASTTEVAKKDFSSPIKSVQKKSNEKLAVTPGKGKMVQAFLFGGSKDEKEEEKEEEKDDEPGGWVMWLFEKALGAIGIDLKALKAMLGKGYDAIGKIIDDPGQFLDNLIEGVKGGIQNFVANIKTHLMKGLATWLFGKFAGAGLEIPDKLDLKGIFKIVMQLLGITYDSIRTRVVTGLGKQGEVIVSAAEKGLDFVKNIVQNGPMAIWDTLKEGLGNLKETVMGGIMNWITTTIIKKGIAKLLLMLNPAGAIVGIIKTVWDVISFFKTNWDKIVSFAGSVINSVYDMAYGNIDPAKNKVENSLGKLIPITLGFISKFIGLDGITKKIIEIIKKIKKPIDNALDKAVGFITKKIKGTKIFKTITKGLDKKDAAKKKIDETKDKIKNKAAEMEGKLDKKIVSSRDARIKKGKESKEAKKKNQAEARKKKQKEKEKKAAEKKKKQQEKKALKDKKLAEKRKKKEEKAAKKNKLKKDKKKKSADKKKEKAVKKGLQAIDKEEKKYTKKHSGKITRDEAEKVAITVKKKHKIFKYLQVIDGQDSWDYKYAFNPGGNIKGGEKKAGGGEGVVSEKWKSYLNKMDKKVKEYTEDKLNTSSKKTGVFTKWTEVRSWLETLDGFKLILHSSYNVGAINVKPVMNAIKKIITEKLNGDSVRKGKEGSFSEKVFKRSQPKINRSKPPAIYTELRAALLEHAFDKSKDPQGAAENAYADKTNDDVQFVLADIPAELQAKIDKYSDLMNELSKPNARGIDGWPGLKGNPTALKNTLEGHAKSKTSPPQFAAGFVTQVEQAIQFANNVGNNSNWPWLSGVEVSLSGHLHCDLLCYETKEDYYDKKFMTIYEIKNWTGYESWDEKKKDDCFASFRKQIINYLKEPGYRGVIVKWKGNIPDAFSEFIDRLKTAKKGKLIDIKEI